MTSTRLISTDDLLRYLIDSSESSASSGMSLLTTRRSPDKSSLPLVASTLTMIILHGAFDDDVDCETDLGDEDVVSSSMLFDRWLVAVAAVGVADDELAAVDHDLDDVFENAERRIRAVCFALLRPDSSRSSYTVRCLFVDGGGDGDGLFSIDWFCCCCCC